MTLEQAIIRTGDTEIPVLALDYPIVWLSVILAFIVALVWAWRKK